MPKITVINHYQLCHEPHEYIGRGSPLGNPFTHRTSPSKAQKIVATREEAIERYREYLWKKIQSGDSAIVDELNRLANIAIDTGVLNLRCYCAPKACHGDVIKEVIEEAINNHINGKR